MYLREVWALWGLLMNLWKIGWLWWILILFMLLNLWEIRWFWHCFLRKVWGLWLILYLCRFIWSIFKTIQRIDTFSNLTINLLSLFWILIRGHLLLIWHYSPMDFRTSLSIWFSKGTVEVFPLGFLLNLNGRDLLVEVAALGMFLIIVNCSFLNNTFTLCYNTVYLALFTIALIIIRALRSNKYILLFSLNRSCLLVHEHLLIKLWWFS